jgi:hypothetical protein
MDVPVWRLEGTSAQLTTGELAATIDLLRPADGLSGVRLGQQPLNRMKLLQVHLLPNQPHEPDELIDAYVRGSDLIATYAQRPPRTVRPQIYWRAIGTRVGEQATGVELILSAQTSFLESDPALALTSSLAANEVWRLTSAAECAYEHLQLSPNHPVAATSSNGTGLFLFRIPGASFSYVEMVHPTDFAAAELALENAAENLVGLTHRLFPENLEKGVIRRGRIRSLFVPRDTDQQTAFAFYRTFADSPPPLTT